jgi:exodeoxyribonuclease V alpha subunit
VELDEHQQRAIETACGADSTIITGGAGTGKTTIIKRIADNFSVSELAICAFAGRAAARITEATGYEASTIHRMLQWRGSFFACKSLRGKVVIVDEASMLTSNLLHQIVRREPKKLILVGDDAQLPPVGPGQPFHDLLTMVPSVQLLKCWRSDAAVYRAAQAVRSGQIPVPHESAGGEVWSMQETGAADKTQSFILDMVSAGHMHWDHDLVLTFRGSNTELSCGAPKINEEIGRIMFPDRGDEKFVPGDRVINSKNNPDKNIWNGTLGFVRSVDPFQVELWDSDRDLVECSPSTWRLGYALTTHKAQGSQFRRVIFAGLKRDMNSGLDRSLLYTAITRAQEAAMVVGEQYAIHHAVRTQRHRRTVMQRLHEQNKRNAQCQ